MGNLFAANSEYQPGICNIGPYEIAKRRRNFYYSLFGTFIVLLLIIEGSFGNILKMLLFIPLLITSVNYLQVRNKFCVFFGYASIVNLGNKESRQKIRNGEAHPKDIKKVRIMFGQAIIFSLLSTTGLYYLLPWLQIVRSHLRLCYS